MGNENSKENSIKEANGMRTKEYKPPMGEEFLNYKKKGWLHSDYFLDACSSYKGIKTDPSLNSILKNEDSTIGITETDLEENDNKIVHYQDIKEVKVPTLFEWRGIEIESVYLTGSFCNWSQKFLMNQINNTFQLNLDLTRGVYQYKFIVDGEWRFSPHHPTCNDGNDNINNIIDTSDYSIPNFPKNKTKKNKYINVNNDFLRTTISSYISEFPDKKDLYLDATICPNSYKEGNYLKKNNNQDWYGKDKNIMNLRNYSNENTSYCSISTPSHVNLTHLNVKSIDFMNQEILITSTSQRVRHKFVTVVYYKPLS